MKTWAQTLIIAASVAGILLFQNCSGGFQAAMSSQRQDAARLAELMEKPELIGIYRGDDEESVSGALVKLRNGSASTLFPYGFDLGLANPISAPKQSIDTSTGWKLWTHDVGSASPSIVATSESEPVLSDRISIVMMMRRPFEGIVLSLNAGSRRSEDFQIVIEGGFVKAVRFTDSSRFATAKVALPASERLIIAASFGAKAADLQIMVNGVISADIVNAASAPFDAPYIGRRLEVGTSETAARLTWGEAQIFTEMLTGYELSLLSRTMGARWKIDGIYDDPGLRDEETGTGASNPLFIAAKNLIENRCVSCHGNWSGRSAGFYKANGLIAPGASTASALYFCAKGSTNARCDTMPSPGLSSSEFQTLSGWIDSEK